MDIVPILPPQSSSPETDVLQGTAVNPPHAMEHEVTPSTHTPAPLTDSASLTGAPASTQDALESTAATDAPATAIEDTSAAVPTAAAEAPVVEVNKPTTEPAAETAPLVLAAEPISEDVAPKEVISAEPTAAVETAAAAVPVDVPTSAIQETKGEEKVAAPEVLAAQPAGEEVNEVVPVEDKAGVGEPVAAGINTAAPAEETKPEEAIAAVSAPHTAPETAPANPVGTEEASEDLVPESGATEQLPKELASEPAPESTQGATTIANLYSPHPPPPPSRRRRQGSPLLLLLLLLNPQSPRRALPQPTRPLPLPSPNLLTRSLPRTASSPPPPSATARSCRRRSARTSPARAGRAPAAPRRGSPASAGSAPVASLARSRASSGATRRRRRCPSKVRPWCGVFICVSFLFVSLYLLCLFVMKNATRDARDAPHDLLSLCSPVTPTIIVHHSVLRSSRYALGHLFRDPLALSLSSLFLLYSPLSSVLSSLPLALPSNSTMSF
ncbi:hypothetical protein HETIRDRAFT_314016 [Heterobasidion irregulare TC 32-1]|uniref:Uncharacterized protein n=1 Tax=Heterobasidion irregulare (strain TC 32-1) TaxID=747525 RepID=W4KF41_HETIT|nr:uncharacterized protein HETIRDRAFT_314016 [Heterobasidion irregulare TC 32-1]ETW84472.1 hypothetical protein HETIRDRAFT_314016 [Heterobasidion irregulare TC 32-1]